MKFVVIVGLSFGSLVENKSTYLFNLCWGMAGWHNYKVILLSYYAYTTLPIMPELSLILFCAYYAKNYASILNAGLVAVYSLYTHCIQGYKVHSYVCTYIIKTLGRESHSQVK